MKTAFLFPGQGAQHVGMGKDLCEADTAAGELFARAEEICSLPLRKLCFEGPEEELSRTDVAQPAIFVVSVALLEAMERRLPPERMASIRPEAAAGLSLGEYTALYAADALDFDDMLRLVARRGQLMQEAANSRPSAMVAVMGLDEDGAGRLCRAAAEGQILSPANFNCPGQIVLSGEVEACRRAEQRAGEFGAAGAKTLDVAGAFHSEIMAPAARRFAAVLEEIEFRDPKVKVVANVDARPYDAAEAIPGKLLAQLTGSVRWQQSMEVLFADGFERFFEIGPGRVLAGLMRRIRRKACVNGVNGLAAVEKLSEA